MKYDEFKKMYSSQNDRRRKPRHIEESIQTTCVEWFRYTYRNYIVFSIPNGGSRNAKEAANMKRAGVLAGVSDLIVVIEKRIVERSFPIASNHFPTLLC